MNTKPVVHCRWYMVAEATVTKLLTGWVLPLSPSQLATAQVLGVPVTVEERKIQRFYCFGREGCWQYSGPQGQFPLNRLEVLCIDQPLAKARVRTTPAAQAEAARQRDQRYMIDGTDIGASLDIGVVPTSIWNDTPAEAVADAEVAAAEQAAKARGQQLRAVAKQSLHSAVLRNALTHVQTEHEAQFVVLLNRKDPQYGGLAVVGTQFVHLRAGEFVLVDDAEGLASASTVESTCAELDDVCASCEAPLDGVADVREPSQA